MKTLLHAIVYRIWRFYVVRRWTRFVIEDLTSRHTPAGDALLGARHERTAP